MHLKIVVIDQDHSLAGKYWGKDKKWIEVKNYSKNKHNTVSHLQLICGLLKQSKSIRLASISAIEVENIYDWIDFQWI